MEMQKTCYEDTTVEEILSYIMKGADNVHLKSTLQQLQDNFGKHQFIKPHFDNSPKKQLLPSSNVPEAKKYKLQKILNELLLIYKQNGQNIYKHTLSGPSTEVWQKIEDETDDDIEQSIQINTTKRMQFDEIVYQFSQMPPTDVFSKLEYLFDEDQTLAYNVCQHFLNSPPTKNKQQQSQQLQKQLITKASKEGNVLSIIMLTMKNLVQTQFHSSIVFSKTSTLQSQISTYLLTSPFGINRITFHERLQQDLFTFEAIEKSKEKKRKFKQWYITKLSNQFKIPKKQIFIHNITKGSLCVKGSAPLKYESQLREKAHQLQLESFIQRFELSQQDFSQKGQVQFDPIKRDGYVFPRGGWPYFQPVGCLRYGINVSGKFDKGCDDWLSMEEIKGEWAVAFHGVHSIAEKNNVVKKVLKGMKKQKMLKAGKNQAFLSDVGNGIYCSPFVYDTFLYVGEGFELTIEQINKRFYLVFQCRVKPQGVRICPSIHQYWVLNSRKEIRCYGILLLTKQQKEDYPINQQLYDEWQISEYEEQASKRVQDGNGKRRQQKRNGELS